MNRLDEFIEYLNGQVENHSIYVWGAQGQASPVITEAWIRNRERDTGGYAEKSYADAAVDYWKRQVAAGYGDRLRAFDCSGLGVYWLLAQKLLPNDTTANGMYARCNKTEHPARGCWVFRQNAARTKMTHIGYLVDDRTVVHAKGRAYGVVREPYSASYWHAVGIPKVFAGEIGQPAPAAEADGQRYVVITGSTVRVRSGGAVTYPKLFTARRGERYPLLGRADGGSAAWYRIKTHAGDGFISCKAKYTRVE